MCLITKAVNVKSFNIPTADKLIAEVEKKEIKLDKLNSKLDELEDEISSLESDVKVLQNEINYFDPLGELNAKQQKQLMHEVAKKVVKVASKDIVCFKKFRGEPKSGEYISLHRNFTWPATKLVTVKAFGFYLDVDGGKPYLQVGEGLHAYTSKKAAKAQYGYYARELTAMIIPKGTKYIIQDDGREIVALAMKIQNPVIAGKIDATKQG